MRIPAIHSRILKYCLASKFSLAQNYFSNKHHKIEIEAPGHMAVEIIHMHDFGSSRDFQSAVSRLPFVQSFKTRIIALFIHNAVFPCPTVSRVTVKRIKARS
eukprot:sb/3478421/